MILPFKTLYKEPTNLFSKILPWAFISDFEEGVVVQKSGLIQCTLAYRGPDLESANKLYVNEMCLYLNGIIKRLGDGWAFQNEVQHYMTRDYPGCDFDNMAAYLVDKEREANFQGYGQHFASVYYLTIIYEPPNEITSGIGNLFFKEKETGFETSLKEAVKTLKETADDICNLLSSRMQIYPLNNDETLEYLHSSISTQRHPIEYPSNTADNPLPPFFLDRILPDEVLEVGMTLKLGDNFIPMLDINKLPRTVKPAFFDALNAVGVEYRWVSRFICKDKQTALKDIEKQSARFFGNRKSWKQTMGEMWTKEETGRINQGAVSMENDADIASIDVENEIVSRGMFTSSIMVWGTTLKEAKQKLQIVKGVIQSTGSTCSEERYNALECFMSMMPGNMFPNIRRVDISSINFAHIIPSSAIWAGELYNSFTDKLVGVSTPLMTLSTGYQTPFFFNMNVGDVGMMFLVGPIGSGKSTALQLIEIQFLKYTGSQVIIIDKGKSARQLTMAVGGRYYEPGTGRIAFQPLERLETQEDILWACEFIEGLLEFQNITITPSVQKEVLRAINLISEMGQRQRTLTTLQQTVSYVEGANISEALAVYCIKGKYGKIFDADHTSISVSKWLMIEMDSLMKLGEACVTPALDYIFHFIERMFTGALTLLVVDEAFLFFKNERFADRFHEWMKTVRKKNVFILFATQEVADIVNSPLCSTITQECLTKIFLADPEAQSPALKNYYKELGLTDSEIDIISHATMKRDYFYKSPKGTRMFQLSLGELTLGLIGSQDFAVLDEMEKLHKDDPEYQYVEDILISKGIEYTQYLK